MIVLSQKYSSSDMTKMTYQLKYSSMLITRIVEKNIDNKNSFLDNNRLYIK